jgi:hypothetical protein
MDGNIVGAVEAKDSSSGQNGSILERLAVLEDRVRPRPKTLVDQVKEWGGVASLVIALAYTWPMGLWDRFITPRSQQQAAQLAQLRGAIETSAVLVSDEGKALSGISNPTFYDAVARSYNTRLYLLMDQNHAGFEARRQELTPSELVTVGYNFMMVNRLEEARDFYEYMLRRHDIDSMMKGEARRELAKIYFMPSDIQSPSAARAYYLALIEEQRSARSIQAVGLEITARAEWGFFEMLGGDWQCGVAQSQLAIDLLRRNQGMLNDQGIISQMILQHTSGLSRRPDQPADGCDGP